MKPLGTIVFYVSVLCMIVGIGVYVRFGNFMLVWTGLIALLCGFNCVAIDKIGERIDALQDQVSQINVFRQSGQRETAKATVDQVVERLRKEGVIPSASNSDDESTEETAER